MAKSQLEAGKELTSVEKITLGRECHYASWVSEGYKELVQKSDTITNEEAIRIELLTAINLFRIREIRLRQSLTSALLAVEEVFAAELSVILNEEMKIRTDQEKEDEMRRREDEEWQMSLVAAQVAHTVVSSITGEPSPPKVFVSLPNFFWT